MDFPGRLIVAEIESSSQSSVLIMQTIDLSLLGQRGANLAVLGEAVGLAFGEDGAAIEQHLKPAVAERLQLQGGDPLFEFFQDFLRQTDGPWFVVSAGAVLDRDLHSNFGDLCI